MKKIRPGIRLADGLLPNFPPTNACLPAPYDALPSLRTSIGRLQATLVMPVSQIINSAAHCVSVVISVASILLAPELCSAGTAREYSIAIGPFTNVSGDTNLDHWTYTIPFLLAAEFDEVKGVEILSDSSTDFAGHEAGLTPSRLIDTAGARRFGRICKASRVIWGTFEHPDVGWRLAVKMIDVGSGKVTEIQSSITPRLTEAIDQQVQAVLSRLNVSVSHDELVRMRTPPTTSEQALALNGRAIAELNHGDLIASALKDFRSALSLDPDMVMAQEGVIHCLVALNKCDEAETMAKTLVATHPDFARAHYEIGLIYSSEGLPDLAKDEFSWALKIDPRNAHYSFLLAVLEVQRNNWSYAVSILERAEKASPFDSPVHALLGYCYANLQRPKEAREQLAMAERYNLGNEALVEQWLGQGYQKLRDQVAAANHFAKFLKLADAVGAHSDGIEYARSTLAYLEARRTPHPLTIEGPKEYTRTELDNIMQTRLGRADVSSVVNPLASSPAMARWARELIGDASRPEDKARRLFEALAAHINSGAGPSRLTAAEVYNNWSDRKMQFNCQDYTVLYVSLARCVGLKAYFVLVRQDHSGKFVGHACAGVFIGGSALLVDPAYDWFGIPHKGYEFEDDLRVMALYLCETGTEEAVDMALRIAPDWSELRFDAADQIAGKGDLKSAYAQLETGLKLESQSWRALFARATLDDSKHDWKAAEDHVRQCLAINPEAPHARLLLARELFAQGDKHAAREELQSLLNGNHSPEDGTQARELIAYLDGQAEGKSEH